MSKQNIVKSVLALGLLSGLIGYVVAVSVVNNRLESTIVEARVDSAEQMATVSALSEIMARGGVDAVTETVIKDCPSGERDRFDTLLSRLNVGVNRSELQELSRLYDRCAAFYARRKAVMTARLDREVQVYDLLTKRLIAISKEDPAPEFFMDEWKELVKLEKSQTETFDKLLVLQGNIINELLEGRAITTPEITELLGQVKETQEMQTYNTVQMGQIRSKLTTL